MSFENVLKLNKNESRQIDYLSILESIKNKNGRLKDIALRFLENPELLKIVPAQFKSNLQGYGVNSIENINNNKIKLKGIIINPEHMTEEVAIHELVHFFSMPALKSAFEAEQRKELNMIAENVKMYWLKTKTLWNYAKSKGYEATNDHSMQDTIVEFAVNFTNEQSQQKLKDLNMYKALIDSFFEYYDSLKIKL